MTSSWPRLVSGAESSNFKSTPIGFTASACEWAWLESDSNFADMSFWRLLDMENDVAIQMARSLIGRMSSGHSISPTDYHEASRYCGGEDVGA